MTPIRPRWHTDSMSSYSAAMGAGLSGLGETVPTEAGVTPSILSHGNLARPAGPVVSLQKITTMAQVRDYARAAFHVVVDAYARASANAPISPFVLSATTYAAVADRAEIVAQYDYGGTTRYAADRAALIADLGTADRQFSAAGVAPAPSAPAPLPSNVTRLPVSQTPPVVPTRVSTAGIGTAKGAAIALGVGLVAWLAFRKKKK